MDKQTKVIALKKDVEDLGYDVTFEKTNPNKPNQVQQMYVYKKGKLDKPIAKVSLMLACRVNTMFNGVGRKQKELFEVLTKFSSSL